MIAERMTQQVTLDFGAISRLLNLADKSIGHHDSEINRVLQTRGYELFLRHRGAALTPEQFRLDLRRLSRMKWDDISCFPEWIPLFEEPDRYLHMLHTLKKHQDNLIREVQTAVFEWLPMMYYTPVKIHFIADGRVTGYGFGQDWICDLLLTEIDRESSVYHDVGSLIFQILHSRELGCHYKNLWYQYREHIESVYDLCKLRVFTMLANSGMSRYLFLHHDRFRRRESDEIDITVTSAASRHLCLAAFLKNVIASASPLDYFETEQRQFYAGKYSTFQLLGSYMCKCIVDHHGPETLRQAIHNPIDFYRQYWDAAVWAGHEAVMGVPLHEIEEPQPSVRPLPQQAPPVWEKRDAPTMTQIRFVDHDGPAHFCVAVAGAGSCADGDFLPGTAHLCEHIQAQRIRHEVPGLVFLKALTTQHHCFYYGTMDTETDVAMRKILDTLFHPTAISDVILTTAKQKVCDEIRLVENNPFYACEELLYRLMFENGFSIRGKIDQVQTITSRQIQSFQKSWYAYPNAVLVLSGRLASRIVESILHDAPSNGDTPNLIPPSPVPTHSMSGRDWRLTCHPVAVCSAGLMFDAGCYRDDRGLDVFKQAVEDVVRTAKEDLPFGRQMVLYPNTICINDNLILHFNYQGAAQNIKKLIKHLCPAVRTAIFHTIERLHQCPKGIHASLPDKTDGVFDLSAVVSVAEKVLDETMNSRRAKRDFSSIENSAHAPAAIADIDRIYLSGYGPEELSWP